MKNRLAAVQENRPMNLPEIPAHKRAVLGFRSDAVRLAFKQWLESRTHLSDDSFLIVFCLGLDLLAELQSNDGTMAADLPTIALCMGYDSTDDLISHLDVLVKADLLEPYDAANHFNKSTQLTIAAGGNEVLSQLLEVA